MRRLLAALFCLVALAAPVAAETVDELLARFA